MFGIGTIELLVVAVATLLFVGPKELPTAMRAVGRFIGKVRAYARHFTAGIDNVIREAELEEMEKEWRAQNEAIMAAYPNPDGDPLMTGPAASPDEETSKDKPDSAKDRDLP